MIFIKFEKGQGLGNQLWHYVTLRSIAKYKSYDYGVLDYHNFKGLKFIEIEKSNKAFNEFKSINEKINNFYETIFYDRDLNNYSCDYDKKILEISDDTILNGLFQSEKYIVSKKEEINNFIKLKKNKIFINEDLDKLCILNVRGGEYKRHKNLILPKSYWTNAIKNMRRFYPNLIYKIVTDDYRYAERLLPGIDIIKGDISSDFNLLNKAKYLIVSNSSFSYFPITMGNYPNIVISPFCWSRFGNKYNRWSSPANCYKNFTWQDHQGNIVSKKQLDFSLLNTRKEFEKYNIRTENKNLNFRNRTIIFLPTKIRRFIKYILSLLFPLKYG